MKKKGIKIKLGNTHHDKLLKSVINYIEAHDGTAIVVGGIETITFPGDREFNYRIAVRVTGKKPTRAPKK